MKIKTDKLKLKLNASKQNDKASSDMRQEYKHELSELMKQIEKALKDIQGKRKQIIIIKNAKIAYEKQPIIDKLKNKSNANEKKLETRQLQQRLEALEFELSKAKLDLNQEIDKNQKIAYELANIKNDREVSNQDLEDLNRVINMAEQEIAGLEFENKKLKKHIHKYGSETESPDDNINTKSTSFEEVHINSFVDEKTDITKFVEAHLRNYDVGLPVTTKKNSNKTGFYSLVIGEKKISAKINNNKLYVLAGGGWYTLQDYIEKYIIKMGTTKSRKSDARQSFGNLISEKFDMSRTSKTPRISLDTYSHSKVFKKSSFISPNKTMKSNKGYRT